MVASVRTIIATHGEQRGRNKLMQHAIVPGLIDTLHRQLDGPAALTLPDHEMTSDAARTKHNLFQNIYSLHM
jgi:hypothetical protein